jgi:hypothetical protein
MTTILTIPQTTIQSGSGSFSTSNIASAVNGYMITVNEVNWPYTGGQAISFTLEASYDGGNTWQLLMGPENVSDDPIPAQKGHLANQFKIAVGLGPEQGVPRKARISYTFSKALTISGQVDTL